MQVEFTENEAEIIKAALIFLSANVDGYNEVLDEVYLDEETGNYTDDAPPVLIESDVEELLKRFKILQEIKKVTSGA